MTTTENVQLRRRLKEMTEGGTEPSTHPAQLETISTQSPHTVRPLQSHFPVNEYTCGMHVFHFSESETYRDIAGLGVTGVYAGQAFFEWLLANRLLSEIEESGVQQGDLIMYFDSGRWKHVGICGAGNRVVSKWGLGLLYDHDRWQIPEDYGTEVLFFRPPSRAIALEHFVAYAQSRGVPTESIV